MKTGIIGGILIGACLFWLACNDSSQASGESLYQVHCGTCHMTDGSGVPGMNPPLAGSSTINEAPERMIQIVLNGMQGQEIEGEKYANIMNPHRDLLDDEQIADILRYVRAQFGHGAGPVSSEEVAQVRAQSP